MQSSISLGIEFILPTQHLIKQALCALPLPCGNCLRQSRVLRPWAAQAAEMWILHGDSSHLLFISPQAEVRVPGLQHSPCWFSWCSHDKPGHVSSTQSNGKIKGLCTVFPGCENFISPLAANEAKPCQLLMSKPSDHPGIKDIEAILPQQCVLWYLPSPRRFTLEMSPELLGIITSHTAPSPNSSHPRQGARPNFPRLRGRMCPVPRIKGAKHPHCQFPEADLGTGGGDHDFGYL